MVQIDEIAALIARHATEDGFYPSSLPRLSLVRSSRPTQSTPAVYKPSLCLIAQGRKQVELGGRSYLYDEATYLAVSVDLPLTGAILEASPERPYLCMVVDIDLPTLSELMLQHTLDPGPEPVGPALGVSATEPGLLEAALRLVRLLDAPADAPYLAPLAEREILYRLLSGAQAPSIRRIAAGESRLRQVSRAIAWLKDNYARPVSVERLAAEAGMSASSFHSHFKAATTMSPLQYRARLRLQEARRMMVIEAVDAASAGFAVGYESPSQFSREYSRVYGAPPYQDALRLRSSPDYALVA
ncbi:AraC family transcriptional regulator [Phenylobacterium sp. J367]|uniref:AraC family transcriptional regulator n=1 Tax=Phenylobacterium sp. J367 TaxID=2898435 RepID=UPI002150FE68|nr:AraC family transcriptional regulator [Phenylobacterium sp. J367]MCR5879127.1 AraC family transcriptional regulator [Phenylobacterium sp. J367]